jgi:anti-sigma factor ChrR (cupin superfamily)
MNLNSDFTARAAVHAGRLDWIPSPIPGVDRRMLDRIGEEVARATSIVRYAPGSRFSPHTHDGGEEFLVLEGVFQDEHGDFPAGSYIRNPPTTSHTPGSEPGCVIFVKLWQFDPSDRTQLRLDTTAEAFVPQAERQGVKTIPLFADAHERVRLERWAPGTAVAPSARGGMELLVLDGEFAEGGEAFSAQSWLRLPAGGRLAGGGRTPWVPGLAEVGPPLRHSVRPGCRLTGPARTDDTDVQRYQRTVAGIRSATG